MYSKRLIAILLAIGIVVSASALFNEFNIKTAFAESVKQNVVYTKEDSASDSQNNFNINGVEEKAYKEKSLDILKKYFNISVEENDNFKFNACVINEKSLNDTKPKEQNEIQESYDNKEISKEEYDKQMAFIEENNNGLKDRIEKLKHGMVQTGWMGVGADKLYMLDFNENTKEVDFVLISDGIPKKSDVKLKISEEELKDIAENFIKQNKLGDLKNPKAILIEKNRIFYEDENDSSKKVEIRINMFTGKVSSFSLNEYAELEYNNVINENK